MKKIPLTFILLMTYLHHSAQVEVDYETNVKEILDSIYIAETEAIHGIDKVLHAEPLFIDLIRDLGARKGEKEWNYGLGMSDRTNFNRYEGLVEYEFAPVNRLGFEIEVPFSIYTSAAEVTDSLVPKNKIESLKLAAQYSFYVSEKNKLSMALGYINESEFKARNDKGSLLQSNKFNPFFVCAKRWFDNYHTLLYTGPVVKMPTGKNEKIKSSYATNVSFHYMITGTRNFVGVEFNSDVSDSRVKTLMRPQMRLGISDRLLIGIVTGIPLATKNERMSTFFRVIYEPH